MHQRVAVLAIGLGRLLRGPRDRGRGREEIDAVGDGVADQEIGDGRDAEIGEDLDQRIDLILLPDGAHLEKGEAGVHRHHHHGADEQKEHVRAVLERVHRIPLPAPAAGPASDGVAGIQLDPAAGAEAPGVRLLKPASSVEARDPVPPNI
jgi:hypothetical protein